MLAILARASGERRIVTTIDASMAIDETGYRVKRTQVGDPFVSEELKKAKGWGGEPSGAWVFPQISLCPDGIYAAAQIASIASRARLSELADAIPSYPVIRSSLAGKADMKEIKKSLVEELKPISIEAIDGIKLLFKDSWLLVRPSGTEPKIRLTIEARSAERLNDLGQKSTRIINEHLNRGQA